MDNTFVTSSVLIIFCVQCHYENLKPANLFMIIITNLAGFKFKLEGNISIKLQLTDPVVFIKSIEFSFDL